jgi:hypothetical protein
MTVNTQEQMVEGNVQGEKKTQDAGRFSDGGILRALLRTCVFVRKVGDIASYQDTLLEVPPHCHGRERDLWSWRLTAQSMSVNVNIVHASRILVVRLTLELNLTSTAERSTN